MTMENELHLFIIWEKARYKERAILDDIATQLHILEVLEIEWDKKDFSTNLTRFYGQKLPPGSSKEEHCGKGRFLVVTVLDCGQTDYDYILTSRGKEEFVNVKMFSLKQKYRSWTGGGHRIHATNSLKETNHDLTLLLGINCCDYQKKLNNKKWDQKIISLKRNLPGHNGWNSISELLYTLNTTIKYVILRNYEFLPDTSKSIEHGDIDFLVENFEDAVFVANATLASSKTNRVQCFTFVRGEKIFLDFRHIGDNYYCEHWERKLLHDRVFEKNSFYAPDPESYFYTLIYHCLIHKKEIAEDYFEKLDNLYRHLGLDKHYDINEYLGPFDLYYELLSKYMSDNNFVFMVPNDKTVFFDYNYTTIRSAIPYLKYCCNLKSIKPVNLARIKSNSGSGYLHFVGKNIDNNKLFTKWGGIGNSAKREFETLQELYSNNFQNFLKPYYCECQSDVKYLALEYFEGNDLETLIATKKLNEDDKNSIIKQLYKIGLTLLTLNLVHRDIKPDNLLFSDDKRLVLIDNQYCVDKKNELYPELDVIRRYPRRYCRIGTDEFIPSKGKWDDIWSILKIIDLLDANAKEKYPDIYGELLKKTGTLEYQIKTDGINKLRYHFKFVTESICRFKAMANIMRYLAFKLFGVKFKVGFSPLFEISQTGDYSLYELYRHEYKRIKKEIL